MLFTLLLYNRGTSARTKNNNNILRVFSVFVFFEKSCCKFFDASSAYAFTLNYAGGSNITCKSYMTIFLSFCRPALLLTSFSKSASYTHEDFLFCGECKDLKTSLIRTNNNNNTSFSFFYINNTECSSFTFCIPNSMLTSFSTC